MKPAKNARNVGCDIENLVSLKVKVAVERGYEMLSGSYQDVERPFFE